MKKVYTESYVGYLQSLAQDIISLNTPLTDVDDTELQDILVDPKSNLIEQMEIEAREKAIESYFKQYLTPREIMVLRLRFGFEDGETWTLADIGKKFGVTRERIRQIEEHALYRLKKNFKVKNIKREDI